MKKIQATFIGEDKSLGYDSQKKYVLFIGRESFQDGSIFIRRLSGGGECVYSSILTFLDNWTEIRNID